MVFSRRLQELGNCIGQGNECKEASVLFTVTTADAQSALIAIAAGLSLVKCVVSAMGNYSPFHVALDILALGATLTAFMIFQNNDFDDTDLLDRVEAGYGDDIVLYRIAYISAMIVQAINAAVTMQTLSIYTRIQIEPFGADAKQGYQKSARYTYIYMLLLGMVLCGAIVPLIAFGKADWETDNLSPTNFKEDNAKLLMSAMILAVLAQGFMSFPMTLTLCRVPTRKILLFFFVAFLIGLTPLLAHAGILYTVLARVSSGDESGGLAFLVLIYAIQGMEFYAEIFRYIHWLQIELAGRTAKSQQEQLEFQQGFAQEA